MKLLISCAGNTCRSPMAAAIALATPLCKEEWVIWSRACGADHIVVKKPCPYPDGLPANHNAIVAIRELLGDTSNIAGHVPARMTMNDAGNADQILILANKTDVERYLPEKIKPHEGKLRFWEDCCETSTAVPDPFDLQGFEIFSRYDHEPKNQKAYNKVAEYLQRHMLAVLNNILKK